MTTTTAIAKVFMSGRSQAVRLPKAFRLDAAEVRVRREGSRLILEPIEQDWGWLNALIEEGAADGVDEDFAVAAAEDEGPFERPDVALEPVPAGVPDPARRG